MSNKYGNLQAIYLGNVNKGCPIFGYVDRYICQGKSDIGISKNRKKKPDILYGRSLITFKCVVFYLKKKHYFFFN